MRIEMIAILFSFVIAITNANATQTTQNELNFEYIEFVDIRDSTNNYENLRFTYRLCNQINDTQQSIEQCQNFAYTNATSIDV